MKNKNILINQFFEDVIKPISDKEYQERIWVKGLGPESDSFDETINDFFYFTEKINKDYKKYELEEDEYDLVKKMEEQIIFFCSSQPVVGNDAEIIKDPHWHKIQDLAKEVYEKLKRFH